MSGALLYDPETHTSTCDGRPVPHVTEILSDVQVSTDFAELSSFGSKYADRIEYARALGKAAHEDCHAYDDDDLDLDRVHTDVRPYLDAYGQLREDLGLEPEERERQIFNEEYWYTGFLDGIYRRGKLRILGDLKTGDPSSAAAHLQTVAYEKGWKRRSRGKKIDERWGIWLCPERQIPYRIFNYSNVKEFPDTRLHWSKFVACLTVYNEKRRK